MEVKGEWQLRLERGERLEDVLHDPERSPAVVQAIQQVFGDAVYDEAPLLAISNYHCTVFMRRSKDVHNKTMLASTPVWFDQPEPPARFCWVHFLQQAQELRELKRKLPRAMVPPTLEGHHIKQRPQLEHGQQLQPQQAAAEPQAAAEQGAGAAGSTPCSKRQRFSRQQEEPTSSRLSPRLAMEASLCIQARSAKGYTEASARFPQDPMAAAGSLTNPGAEEVLVMDDFNVTDELLGAGPYSYTYKGTANDEPVAVKVYNLKGPQGDKAAAAYENEKLVYGGLEKLQGNLIPRLIRSGVLVHLNAPTLVTSFEGVALAKGQRVPQRLHKHVRGALEALHATGAAHGDVRRANILVDEADKVTIIDFGEAVLNASNEQVATDKLRLKEMLDP